MKRLRQIVSFRAKVPLCWSWNQGSFNILTWGQLYPSFETFLRSQSHFSNLSQKTFEQKSEITLDGRQANITSVSIPTLGYESVLKILQNYSELEKEKRNVNFTKKCLKSNIVFKKDFITKICEMVLSHCIPDIRLLDEILIILLRFWHSCGAQMPRCSPLFAEGKSHA